MYSGCNLFMYFRIYSILRNEPRLSGKTICLGISRHLVFRNNTNLRLQVNMTIGEMPMIQVNNSFKN